MDKKNIQDFSDRQVEFISEAQWRQYSVLVPLVCTQEGVGVLFEQRASSLSIQPNEVSFPGGAVEEGETYQEAAVRETLEELLIEESQVRVLGPSDIFMGVNSRMVHPFIGQLKNYEGSFSKDEVQSIFIIPIDELMAMEPEIYINQVYVEIDENFPYEDIPNGKDYNWGKGTSHIYFYRWKDHIVWGLTARILSSALGLIEEYNLLDCLVPDDSLPKD